MDPKLIRGTCRGGRREMISEYSERKEKKNHPLGLCLSMDYLPTLYTAIALLLVLLSGSACRVLRVYPKVSAHSALSALNTFLFYACLPCTVFRALAIHPLRDLDWMFVLVFLVLRVLEALLFIPIPFILRGKFEDYIIHYLGATFADTIIFGVPLITSLYGSDIGNLYPVLAAISSFIFQLPYMLIVFEVTGNKRNQVAREIPSGEANDDPAAADNAKLLRENSPSRQQYVGQIAKSVAIRLLKVPPLYGIVLGIIYSLIGWDVPSFLDQALQMFANCVTPTATFIIGIFIADFTLGIFTSHTPFKTAFIRSSCYIPYKLLIMPALVIPILYMFNHTVTGDVANVAIIVASLPLAPSAFTLGKQYTIGESELGVSVAGGTLLMLPTVMSWIAILNAVDFGF
ncbi:auxin efflux carrier family protein [Pelomyxa schiedti]|nr:auxin efflux carrier family protein [Pelomyxa schiedti]